MSFIRVRQASQPLCSGTPRTKCSGRFRNCWHNRENRASPTCHVGRGAKFEGLNFVVLEAQPAFVERARRRCCPGSIASHLVDSQSSHSSFAPCVQHASSATMKTVGRVLTYAATVLVTIFSASFQGWPPCNPVHHNANSTQPCLNLRSAIFLRFYGLRWANLTRVLFFGPSTTRGRDAPHQLPRQKGYVAALRSLLIYPQPVLAQPTLSAFAKRYSPVLRQKHRCLANLAASTMCDT